MEIRLGVQHSPREVVVETEDTADALAQRVEEAVTAGGPLRLTDEKGRIVIVPAEKITYAEISTEEPRRVGFLG